MQGSNITTRWCVLKAVVRKPVGVRSWQLPAGHVAVTQCFWVTGGAEALYPSVKEVQTSSP